ncbi:MAG: hypothetical protein ACJ787_22255, partial [Myxococcales bacterium]
ILLCSGVTVLAFGCSSGKTTFNSKADLQAAPPLTRVFVISRVQNAGFNNKVYEGFGSCGVQSEVMHVNDMDLDPDQRFAEALERFHPDAVLFVRQSGGNVIIGQYSTNSDLIIDMKFLAPDAKKPFWHARSEFTMTTENMYRDDTATGTKFANDTIDRLQVDGLLKDCKARP